MKRSIKKRIIAGIVALGIANFAIPAFAYNAEKSELTGNRDGLEMAKCVAEEGMVMLKNNGALPFDKGEKIAVFGINQIDFIYGGGGSGNFNSKNEKVDYISLYAALKEKADNGEIELYEKLMKSYETYYNNYWSQDGRTYGYGTRQGSVIKYWGEMELKESDVTEAAKNADSAIITIGRPAGEDSDRSNSEGDFKLNSKEKSMIEYVKNAGFKKITVVLNVTGVIESDWLDDEGIDAVLYVSLPGMMGGEAIADVLMGDAYPSGKLVDTWASDYADYPSSSNFGNSSYTNYKEDIFVGYRYFETIPNASEKVNYPFGYGLTYADFEISDAKVEVTGDGRNRVAKASATVTNKGKYPGKEVVQLYASSPETNLTQPKRELCGFYKTKELKAGESEKVSIEITFDELASYDDTGVTGYEAAYVLEKGEYRFYLGNSVRGDEAGSFYLEKSEITQQLSHQIVPNTDNLGERMKSDGSYEKIEKRINAAVSDDDGKDVDAKYKKIYTNESVTEYPDDFITFNDLAKAFADGESDDDTKMLEAFVARLTDEEAVKLTGCTTPQSGKGHRTGIGGLDVYNVPVIGTSNGPAGIQYNGSLSTWETTSTFYPCATMQASTWNEELIEQLGAAMADEARYFGMSLWQAPGMNIHRDVLCGRNFEYFSEDPYVTGKMGAAITRGVQSRKFASQIKHFAFNNQERGRWGNDSRISERAAREIYLKGFEIAVKEGKPWSVMSSYNRINGTQTSGSYSLLTEILRNEWGFDGFVMTDFRTRNVSHAEEIAAGNDLKAPADSPNPSNVYWALENGTLERWQVLRSAERVLRFILKTEDAEIIANEEFKYNIAISTKSDKITVVENKVKIKDSLTWKEFLDSITATYGQTYVLLDKKGEVVENEDTNLEIGMKIKVTAEDELTQKIFEITGESLALNKKVKASYTQSGYPEANAVDGDYSTRWSGFSQNYVWNDWIEVDLENDYHITRIDLTYYKGDERSYSYEIYSADHNAEKYWSDKNRSRDFAMQGYNLSAKGSTDNERLKTDNMNEYARFVSLKTTDAQGAYGPTVCEIEIYGWRLTSDEYIIDEENKTVAVWDGDTTSDAKAKLKIEGLGEVEFVGGNDTWVNEGEKFVVTDQNGVKTEYDVITLYNYSTDLKVAEDMKIDNENKLLFVTGNDSSDKFEELIKSERKATVTYFDTNDDGLINYGDKIEVVAEDKAHRAVFEIVTGDICDAKGAVATYEENESYSAGKVADNDLSSRWSAYNKGVNQAVCIDLGETKTVTAVGSYWFGDGRKSVYDIYVSDEPTVENGKFTPDGYAKKNLVSYGTSGNGKTEEFEIVNATGRYVTVYTTENSNNVVSLWEVDVYVNDETFEAKVENGNVVIKTDEECIAGIYKKDGTLIKAVTAKKDISFPFDKDMAYVKAFFWSFSNKMMPLKKAVYTKIL